jgi:hypothetical protein
MTLSDDIARRERLSVRALKESGLLDGARIASMSIHELPTHIQDLTKTVDQVQMGGRSVSLLGLCTLLWYAPTPAVAEIIDVERLIGSGFRIAGDPSFAFPQLGVLLSGILISKHVNVLPSSVRDIVREQTRRVLAFIGASGRYTESVHSVTSCLLAAWGMDLQDGVREASRLVFADWPASSVPIKASGEVLDRFLANVAQRLPVCWSPWDWRLYQCALEIDDSLAEVPTHVTVQIVRGKRE